MNDRSSVRGAANEPLETYDDGRFDSGLAERLPAPLPAASEWFAGPLAVAGIGCLAGMAIQVASGLGLGGSAPIVTQIADKLVQLGGSPALLGIGGSALIGLAMGATARLRQTRRVLEAMGQTPDYGAWLEDLDEGLQRMHVSLVTVESHLAGSIRNVGDELVERVEAATHSGGERGDRVIQELGARLMRLESSVGAVSATVGRLEELQDRTAAATGHDERVLDELGARIDQLVRSLQHDLDLGDSTEHASPSEGHVTAGPRPRRIDDVPPTVEPEVDEHAEAQELERTELERAATAALHANTAERSNGTPSIEESVDGPAAAMPTQLEALEDDPCPVDNLPLFASVEGTAEVTREAEAHERSASARRNPYDA
ncbi:hypothetical protein Pla163_08890 [Planctomycetes bacterium Pla163]|uniref:Uncharacterized protein n=1 Tax=Rohdeia mirabilis TaxID=2528008 RepID=A0A518CX62_9BACT|nr:hypothetical protein Pla163_08890 [Planctomycetes bacterium Pla163]